MHAISSYRGNISTHTHTHTHKHRPPPPQTGSITIHCADKLSAQCKDKVKVSHTRNERRVLELIPVLGSQPAGDRSPKPGVGCHCFPPGPRLPPQPPSITAPLADTKLYCLVTEAHVCKQLAQSCTRQRIGWDSNS